MSWLALQCPTYLHPARYHSRHWVNLILLQNAAADRQDMSGSPFAAADVQRGAKRRSFPGSKPANESSENQISVTASTSQPAAKLFTPKHASKYAVLLALCTWAYR